MRAAVVIWVPSVPRRGNLLAGGWFCTVCLHFELAEIMCNHLFDMPFAIRWELWVV